MAQKAIDWFEKKGEQKPANKVEPKFKIGDWIITSENKVLQITSIEGTSYRFNNVSHYWEICCCDEKCRLWTIQDAKDGDVLHSTGFHSDCVFIFNGLDNWKFDEPNGDRAVATGYCGLFVSADNMEFGIQGPDCIEVDTVKPSTKIQRDLLFQKMKEEGYEWDDEKKELKKIEQTSADETPYPETLEKAIDLYYYSYGNGKGEFEHLSLEKFRDIVLTFVSDYGQKSSWSEKDEEMFNRCIKTIKGAYYLDGEALYWLENRFKSLRPQSQWNPSEEQMGVIAQAVAVLKVSGYGELGDRLGDISEQLNKLMEK